MKKISRTAWAAKLASMALLGAGAALLTHCNADDPSASTPPQDGDTGEVGAPLGRDVARPDGITGRFNAAGLRPVYDPSTQTLGLALDVPLGPRDTAYLSIRRGRLSSESEANLDEPTMARRVRPLRATNQPIAGVAVYWGERVDPAILRLATLRQDPGWSELTLTPALQAEMELGLDEVIETVVLREGVLAARVQTGLYAAISAHDELIDTTPRELPISPYPQFHISLKEGTHRPSAQVYAQLCVDVLGEIPFFPKYQYGSYGTFDCRDFAADGVPLTGKADDHAMIPVTVDDVAKSTCPTGNVGQCFDKCDRPQYLGQNCETGVTVSHRKNSKGTEWTLLCRKVDTTSPTTTKSFGDIAMIGHNPTTGKTCFFQNQLGIKTNGEQIPHPADADRAKDLWKTEPVGASNEAISCGGCHSADAFVHSPWIDQAHNTNGGTIVPKLAYATTPYSLVNQAAQMTAVGGAPWTMPRQIVARNESSTAPGGGSVVENTVQPCLGCHRIGVGKMASEFAARSVGDLTSPYFAHVTDSYKQPAKAHWMPLGLPWSAAYDKAAKGIAECQNGTAQGANFTCVSAEVPH